MPVSALLQNNSHIEHQGYVLSRKYVNWITGKILDVKDINIKGPSRFITFQDVCNNLGNSPSEIHEHNIVRAAVYMFVHSHNVCDTVDTVLSDLPLFCIFRK